MKSRTALLSVVILIMLGASATARQLGSFDEYVASVPDDFACGKSVVIRIDAGSAGAFDKLTSELAQAVGLARVALRFECPVSKEIVLKGYHQDNYIARTTLSVEDGWALSGSRRPTKRMSLPKVGLHSTGLLLS